MQTDKNLGIRIKEARNKAGLTQEVLAKMLGIAYPTLNKYEKGHRIPDAELLSRIAKELKCDPAWLLTGEGERERFIAEKPLQVAEETAPYGGSDKVIRLPDDPKLSLMLRQVMAIYKAGSTTQKALVRGIIEEVYDELKEKTGRG